MKRQKLDRIYKIDKINGGAVYDLPIEHTYCDEGERSGSGFSQYIS
jgi:hypothetical protein